MQVLYAAADQSLFSPANALTTLLTVESLLFAGAGAATSLSATTTHPISPRLAARRLALGVSCALTAVALGAGVAWARVFLEVWPSRIDEQIPAICLVVGIAVQPVVAWTVVWLLYRRRR